MTTQAADALMSIFGFERVTLRSDDESGKTAAHGLLEVVMSDKMREEFESAVIERMKESGFLAIEVRVEMLGRDGEGYSDPSADAYWHYWQASRTAIVVELPVRWKDSNMMFDSEVIAAIHAAGVKTK